MRFYRAKYQQDFISFSERIGNEEENFEHFDDFIEWKAYENLYHDTVKKIEDLRSGNFQVAQ